MTEQALKRSYRSFSGVDIAATFDGVRIGTLQGISYTVTREKAPQYVMGKVDPISFSRGKRGIAGSLIFLIFDRSNLIDHLNKAFYADSFDIRRNNAGGVIKRATPAGNFAIPQDLFALGLNQPAAAARDAGGIERARPWYHDQMPPFDIVLTAATEYGQVCRMAIHNCEILNAGSGISIDDITTDENMTFVATDITPWIPLAPGPDIDDNGWEPGTLGAQDQPAIG